MKKSFDNAQLICKHFGQKRLWTILSKTFLIVRPTFWRFRQNNKKIVTYNVKLSTTFVLNIFFSDDFLFGLEGEGIEIFARILLRNFHTFRDVLH